MAKGGGGKGGKGAGKGNIKGGGRRGGGGHGPGLQGFAHQQVLQAEIPIEQQIAAEKQANLAKAQAQMGFAKAAAAIMQNAAPAVGNAYSSAANSDAGYSRALGSGTQALLNQNQNQSNQFLSQMGTPAGALHQAAPVGDVAYGLQGYIPATSLQREGAAWESAAQLAPGNQLTAGQEAAGATLNGPDTTLNSLHTDLAKIAATEPSVYDKLVGIQQAQARLGQGQQRLNLTAQRDNVLAQQGQERIKLEGARLQVSIRQAAQRNAQAWARIGIENKRLKMEAAKSQAKLNTGGFTPDELVHIKSTAADMAQALHDGVPATSTKPALPPKSYKQAMSYMVSHGIPPTIAAQELHAAGYKDLSSPAVGGGGGFLDGIGMAARTLGGGGPLGIGGAIRGLAGSIRGHEQMIANAAAARGLDPAAVLAIASQEGLTGQVGDHGTSFGPFQLHAGGALPAAVWARGPRYAQEWAWSPQGIAYALDRMAHVARGLRGRAAIAAISRGFERPANPQAEIAGALANYGQF